MAPAVVLVGPPGAGKSSVATALATLLQMPVRDVDADIETAQGMAISQIFTDYGEPHFRELEQAAVAQALDSHDGVLALGGGAVLSAVTRERLRSHRVVFLSVSMPVGVRRTGLASNRPLLVGINPRATYKALLAARLPLYREVAQLEIDTDDKSVSQVAKIIAAWTLGANPLLGNSSSVSPS